MNIYLVRHGIAEEQAASGLDRDRQLTDIGRKRLRLIAEGLKKIDVNPNRILHSTYPRAAETAAILAHGLGLTNRLIAHEGLCYNNDIQDRIYDILDPHESSIMLVGHQPDMSLIVEKLAGQGAQIHFKKGSVARLDLDEIGEIAQLIWLLTPKVGMALGQ